MPFDLLARPVDARGKTQRRANRERPVEQRLRVLVLRIQQTEARADLEIRGRPAVTSNSAPVIFAFDRLARKFCTTPVADGLDDTACRFS